MEKYAITCIRASGVDGIQAGLFLRERKRF